MRIFVDIIIKFRNINERLHKLNSLRLNYCKMKIFINNKSKKNKNKQKNVKNR